MNDVTDEGTMPPRMLDEDDDFGPFVGLFWCLVCFAVMAASFAMGFYWQALVWLFTN